MGWLGGLLQGAFSGAGSIIGSWLHGKQEQKIADKSNDKSAEIAQQNYEHQKEFAQHGLKWSVDQARELGINPLVVAGGPGASFTPSSAQVFSPEAPDYSNGLARMGQGVGRAVTAVMDKEERAKQNVLDALNLEHAKLNNDYIRAQIAATNASITKNGNSPALPLPDGSQDKPYRYYDYYVDDNGLKFRLPSQNASNAAQANTWANAYTSAHDVADHSQVTASSIVDASPFFQFYKLLSDPEFYSKVYNSFFNRFH